MTQRSGRGEYIIEFVPNGKFMKVSAIDPDTLLEVSIVGSVTASKMELQSIAVQKLEYVMNKKKEEQAPDPAPKGRGGIIV